MNSLRGIIQLIDHFVGLDYSVLLFIGKIKSNAEGALTQGHEG